MRSVPVTLYYSTNTRRYTSKRLAEVAEAIVKHLAFFLELDRVFKGWGLGVELGKNFFPVINSPCVDDYQACGLRLLGTRP